MTDNDTTRTMRTVDEAETTQLPAPAMPGPLDLAGRSEATSGTDATDVLSLDELFDSTEPDPAPFVRPAAPVATADAPTWTAMPLPPPPPPAPAPAGPEPTVRADKPQRGPSASAELAARLRADTLAALNGGRQRSTRWLRNGDNAVILLTALVTLVLIASVAALAS